MAAFKYYNVAEPIDMWCHVIFLTITIAGQCCYWSASMNTNINRKSCKLYLINLHKMYAIVSNLALQVGIFNVKCWFSLQIYFRSHLYLILVLLFVIYCQAYRTSARTTGVWLVYLSLSRLAMTSIVVDCRL